MAEYEALRAKHEAEYHAQLPQHFARIAWPAERLAAERESRLRTTLAVAKERSPWHRARLAHIDATRATEADLASIPPMTKHDLMDNFDAILTDRRLTRAIVERHVDALSDDAYLLDEYHVAASGGSSGTRGVFVYDWDGWLLCFIAMSRFRMKVQRPDPSSPPLVTANIAAGKATHMTFAMGRTFGAGSGIVAVPATLPLADIVSRLNELQPDVLRGYPTTMAVLAKEALAGRLRVTPRLVGVGSEPLLPEMRAAIETAWACPLFNVYGTSEGASAGSCGSATGMHLNEDLCIFEPVDADGGPVPPGERAAKLYVTRLYNDIQPLIRYEMTDEVTVLSEPCPCGSSLRRIDDIEGRADDVFVYPGGVLVHPLVFRSKLGADPHIIEYQVRQTPHGATIALRADGNVAAPALTAALEAELRRLGLHDPAVTIEIVSSFDRQATGKLKRFFPLSG